MFQYFDAHTHKQSSDAKTMAVFDVGLRLPEKCSMISVGIHPWSIVGNSFESELQMLLVCLQSDAPIAAIGECGLDASYNKAGIHVQMDAFEAQLKLAMDYNIPVIVHCVKAFPQMLVLLKKLRFNLPVILHSPRVDVNMKSMLADFDTFYSIGPLSINWKNGIEMLQSIPANRLLCETDDTDSPIEFVYQRIASLMNIEVHNLVFTVRENFMKAFNTDGKRKLV